MRKHILLLDEKDVFFIYNFLSVADRRRGKEGAQSPRPLCTPLGLLRVLRVSRQ